MAELPRVAWQDGGLRSFADAGVSLADRGLLFGESLYEVIPVTRARARLLPEHVERMSAGAAALGLDGGVPSLPDWERLTAELIDAERVAEGIIYAQVTGGTAPREHATEPRPRPTFFAWVMPRRFPREADVHRGLRVITAPDPRWARSELKTTMLLPAVLGKRQALEAGADEIVFVDGDEVREGGSTSVLVVEDGRIVTVPGSPAILPGVTARWLRRLAAAEGIAVEASVITKDRMLRAQEVFVTATTLLAMPVVSVDGKMIGRDGAGPITAAMARAMREALEL